MPSWNHRLWRYVRRAPGPPQPLPAGQRKRLRPKVEVLERRCLPSHLPAVTFTFAVPAGTPNEVIGPGTVLAVLTPENHAESQLFRFLRQHPKEHLSAIMRWQEGDTVQVAQVSVQRESVRFRPQMPGRPIVGALDNGAVFINPLLNGGAFGGGVTQVTLEFRRDFGVDLLGSHFGGHGLLALFGQQFGQWIQTLGQFLGFGGNGFGSGINIGNIEIGGIGGVGGVGGIGGVNIGGINIGFTSG